MLAALTGTVDLEGLGCSLAPARTTGQLALVIVTVLALALQPVTVGRAPPEKPDKTTSQGATAHTRLEPTTELELHPLASGHNVTSAAGAELLVGRHLTGSCSVRLLACVATKPH